MPHVIFEVSDNIVEKEFNEILIEIHNILVENLPTRLEFCKSRIIRHKNFLVGDGDKNNSFVHLTILVLPGRTKETLKITSKKIFTCLKNNFSKSAEKNNLKLSLEIKNLSEIYLKN